MMLSNFPQFHNATHRETHFNLCSVPAKRRLSMTDRRDVLKGIAAGAALVASASSPLRAETANSAAWDTLVAAGKRDGALKIAGHPSDLRRNAFTAFQKVYPDIAIEYAPIGSHNQADARLKAEWDAKVFNWDILATGEQYIYYELVPAGALVPIREVIVKDDIMDDKLWNGGLNAAYLDKAEKYVFGFMIYIAETAYINTSVYPLNNFKSARDLMDPQYKGKIALVDPRIGGVVEAMIGFIYHSVGADGLRYILTEQAPHVVGTSRQLLDAMLRGGKPIGIGVTTGTLRDMRDAGLGDSIQRPDLADARNVGRSGGFVAIPKAAPHPNAARLFTNWLLSRDGQTAWVKAAQENSARLDAPVADSARFPDPQLEWFTWDREQADFLNKYQLPARQIAAEILGSRKN
jgi:iron(III) transport system substrate-binding protein